ncbi:MAG: hypothetical protein NXI31_11170 [bacterium]|nr:hypothetical protein [bacterium]
MILRSESGFSRAVAMTFALLLPAVTGVTFTADLTAQSEEDAKRQQLARLQKEQQEILRKTERLKALMERLRERYQREGKKEQVDLLNAGLEHIKEAQLLRDAASIRDDLSATALSEAVRKQRNVVENLEKLLNILLDRRSVESLTELEKAAAERALAARELERRQQELQQATAEALQSEPNATEQDLLNEINDLANAERREAQRNLRESGQRRPFLESALARVNELLRQSNRLDRALEEETGARQSTRQQRQFDLGEMIQQARDLARDVRGQGRQQELGDAAAELGKQAEGNDTQAVQQAKSRFEALAHDAPKLPETVAGKPTDPEWAKLAEDLTKAPAGETEAERGELKDLAERGAEIATKRGQETTDRNVQNSGKLAENARKLADRLQQDAADTGANAKPTTPEGSKATKASKALEQAAKALEAAQAAAQSGDTQKARQQADRAVSALEQARAQHAAANPDAAEQAARMAAESRATGEELANSPQAEDAEQQADAALQRASEALRNVEEEVNKSRQTGGQPDSEQPAGDARQQLEAAKDTLEKALAQATDGRQQDLAAAAERQSELAQQARSAAEAMQQAVENGQLTQEQAKQASGAMKQAQQSMQRASKQLQNGQQSQASQSQQQAAQQLEKAMEQLQENRPVTEEQKAALAEEAKRQQELAEDIVRLAEMLEDREQQRARQKLDEAAQAAQRAQQAMERGDQEETREQQEEARQKLKEAAEELEEERDRYQDLRQEELLFKMKEELLAFLEKQRPISEKTLEAQKIAENGRLSRPMRRKLNQLGEEELELASRIDFLVQALDEEGNKVYRTVLQSNFDDLKEISDRLSGRRPDVGTFTTLMQDDVVRRSENLLAALERERKRREQERQEQQQQQQGENKFNPQRERLVSLIAELEMLKQLLEDTGRANRDLHLLISSRGDENISESEAALVERLAHRHGEITRLFLEIKAAVEETMQAMEEQQGGGEEEEGGRGR